MSILKRIDPDDCGCTDCITGYSKPINYCTQDELKDLYTGVLYNASGCELIVTVDYQEDRL